VATALAGAWRPAPPPLSLSPKALARLAPRLLETGAAALVWRRLRQPDPRSSPTSSALRQAYHFQVLQARLQERAIEQVVGLLQAAGIDPVLSKGWATARLYPEAGLRPVGDIDLYVRPEQYTAARALLRSASPPQWPVDLHCGFPDLPGDRRDDWHVRTRLVRLGEVQVRVLGIEDQLRHLCLHLLRHGAWRPLWLCDVAAALESVPADFDWDYGLRGSRRQSQSVVCALGLANRLLDARLDDARLARRARRLPSWLLPAVLQQWGSPYRRYTGLPLAAQLRHPASLWQAFHERWPNPIEATVSTRGAFSNAPRLPYQLSDCLMRTIRFLSRPTQSLQDHS
jgi:hypothetical protein